MLRRLHPFLALALTACNGISVSETRTHAERVRSDGAHDAPGTMAGDDSHFGPEVPDSGAVRQIGAGGYFTCAVSEKGAVKCWGENAYGDLGLGDGDHRGDEPSEMGASLPEIDLGDERAAATIAVGFAHVCALLDDGEVKCWGHNSVGQLGLGDTEDRGDAPFEMGDALPAVDLGVKLPVIALAAGADHTCALFETGKVKCWGFNYSGQLGLGDTKKRGAAPGQMGAALPFVDLGEGRTARQIVAGGSHTCALLDGGAVKCWGENMDGELGLGDHSDRGDSPGEMGSLLPEIDFGPGRRATALSAGWDHTCAVLDDGAVKCWGHDDYGQLGLGTTDNRGDSPGQMGSPLPEVDLGQGLSVGAVATGIGHSCALTTGGLKCWGDNGSGRLGLGDSDGRGDDPSEMGDVLPFVDLGKGLHARSVRPGGMHTCALLEDGTVKCWGDNYAGQLGQGDTKDRGDDPSELGDALPPIDLGFD